jgi:hypothetical protein
MKTEPKESVLQDWVTTLPFMQQALLMLATRGPDGLPKHTPAKHILHYLRGLVIKPAHPDFKENDGFMNIDYGEPTCAQQSYNNGPDIIYEFGWKFDIIATQFFEDVDSYPLHFYMHLVHASEVIGYHYPEPGIANCWYSFYCSACSNFHMNPETREQLAERLKF